MQQGARRRVQEVIGEHEDEEDLDSAHDTHFKPLISTEVVCALGGVLGDLLEAKVGYQDDQVDDEFVVEVHRRENWHSLDAVLKTEAPLMDIHLISQVVITTL